MRVTTAFNRMLRLPGASVIDVCFGAEGVIVTVRLRRRRRVCSGCGQLGGHIHGRRLKRWRHLDLGANRCLIECELRRLWCPDCGARYEAVPWARAGSRYTRDFEDVVAWLAQQMAKTPIAGLLRIAWDTVGRDRRARRRRPPRRTPSARPGRDRLRRDQLPPRAALPDHRRRPPHRRDRVVRAGPQCRHPAGVLRPARRAPPLDPGGLDRHVGRLREGDPRRPAPRRDLLRPVPRRPPRPARRRPGPPRRMERPRALPHPEGPLDQGHPLVAAQGTLQAVDRTARAARRGPTGQQGDLPRVPAQGRATAALPARRPTLAPTTSTPGSPGHRAQGSSRSSSSPARSAATEPASSPRSTSDSPTGDSKGSTAASA